MKMTRFLILTIAATALLGITAQAQRTTTKRPTPRNTSARPATLPPLEVRAARVKVDNQFTNVSLFVKNFGPVAQALEALDAEAKTKKLSKQTLDKNTADKQKVVAAIRGLRDGMVKLESEFKVKPALKKYLLNIQGISDLAGQAETSAIAGKFIASNTSLKTVQQKLNDTLVAMPKAEL
jgi:hypothetical protein